MLGKAGTDAQVSRELKTSEGIYFMNTQKAALKISIILESSSKLSILNFPLFYLLTFYWGS